MEVTAIVTTQGVPSLWARSSSDVDGDDPTDLAGPELGRSPVEVLETVLDRLRPLFLANLQRVGGPSS